MAVERCVAREPDRARRRRRCGFGSRRSVLPASSHTSHRKSARISRTVLRRISADGYIGGIVLFALLALLIVGPLTLLTAATVRAGGAVHWVSQVFLVYSFLALGDLIRHVWRIETALTHGDLTTARAIAGKLVGRDIERLDAAGCRRAAIESLSENLTDGFTSSVFWYMIAGLPGLALFKVVSTMDSMVGTRRLATCALAGAARDSTTS